MLWGLWRLRRWPSRLVIVCARGCWSTTPCHSSYLPAHCRLTAVSDTLLENVLDVMDSDHATGPFLQLLLCNDGIHGVIIFFTSVDADVTVTLTSRVCPTTHGVCLHIVGTRHMDHCEVESAQLLVPSGPPARHSTWRVHCTAMPRLQRLVVRHHQYRLQADLATPFLQCRHNGVCLLVLNRPRTLLGRRQFPTEECHRNRRGLGCDLTGGQHIHRWVSTG